MAGAICRHYSAADCWIPEGNLLDLDAREAIEDIRLFFAKDCVDITCTGDHEEVEIEPGFRSKRGAKRGAGDKIQATI